MTKYDDISWHYGRDFPEGLSRENASTHIGLYLAWLITRDLCDASWLREAGEGVARVRAREITGAVLLREACDEKLIDAMLNDEGNAFTSLYYDKTDSYIDDFSECLGGDLPSAYHVVDSWENFDALAAVIDARFKQWIADGRPGPLTPANAKKALIDGLVPFFTKHGFRKTKDGFAKAHALGKSMVWFSFTRDDLIVRVELFCSLRVDAVEKVMVHSPRYDAPTWMTPDAAEKHRAKVAKILKTSASFSAQVGPIQERTWELTGLSEIPRTVAEMARTIEGIAFPFFASHQTLDTLKDLEEGQELGRRLALHFVRRDRERFDALAKREAHIIEPFAAILRAMF